MDSLAAPADSAALAASAALLAFRAAPADSARLTFEAGLGADYTNEILWEQTFDSTAVTGRLRTGDARGRAVTSLLARAAGVHGPLSWSVANDAGVGPTVRRELLEGWASGRLGDRFVLRVDGTIDARKDGTFDVVREDRRIGGGASLRWTAADLSTGARLFARAENLRSAEGSLALFPDYGYAQVGAELDRFGLKGHGALTYSFAGRAFPDTASRDYREHDVDADFALWPSDRWRLEGRADAQRRVAWRDSAVGDRFVAGDGQMALWLTPSTHFEWGPTARLRLQSFDAPSPTFYDVWIARYGLAARFQDDKLRRRELRPELELLRTPRAGGLPDTASAAERAAVESERYEQLSVTLEDETIGTRGWTWLTLELGHRHYAADGQATSLTGRSSYWYGDLSGFLERPLAGRWRVRATGDLRSEWHAVGADDLRSVDLGLEIRTRL